MILGQNGITIKDIRKRDRDVSLKRVPGFYYMSMHRLREKYGTYVFIAVVLFCYYGLYYQAKKNPDLYKRRMDKVKESMSKEGGHPLTLFSQQFESFVKAYYMVLSLPEKRFWIISDYLDPAILLNYYIYPKEVRMPANTQDFINMKYLTMSDAPIRHPPFEPPKNEPILYIDIEEVRILNRWDGSQ